MESEHHAHREHHETHHKKKSVTEKIRTNPWIISTFVLGILAILLIVESVSGGILGKTISQDKAAELVLGFVESQVGSEPDLVSVSLESGLYKVIIIYQGSEIPLYVTKDGKSLVQGVLPFSALEETPSDTPSNTEDIPQADKPKVELFVMTHCPYGTQAEKGFIPAILEFGDEIDASIKFVHYFLHDPEETETPIQVCIREEQSDKFLLYLKCFLEDGDSDRCILETGIDNSKVQECIDSGRADDYYEVDSALSQSYGVRGSPTLVVNGEIVSSGRDAASYADTICQAFNIPPELCGSLDLDSANPSTGFGYGTTTAIANAQC